MYMENHNTQIAEKQGAWRWNSVLLRLPAVPGAAACFIIIITIMHIVNHNTQIATTARVAVELDAAVLQGRVAVRRSPE
jgi:hypothetical protein